MDLDLSALPVPPEESFDALVGLRRLEITDRAARAARSRCGARSCSRGASCTAASTPSIAESLASWATAMAVIAGGEIAIGQSNNTSFLRPITAGTIHALATRRHRGRTSWVWDVDITDDEGRLCATSRVTIAVRPRRAGPAGAQPR